MPSSAHDHTTALHLDFRWLTFSAMAWAVASLLHVVARATTRGPRS